MKGTFHNDRPRPSFKGKYKFHGAKSGASYELPLTNLLFDLNPSNPDTVTGATPITQITGDNGSESMILVTTGTAPDLVSNYLEFVGTENLRETGINDFNGLGELTIYEVSAASFSSAGGPSAWGLRGGTNLFAYLGQREDAASTENIYTLAEGNANGSETQHNNDSGLAQGTTIIQSMEWSNGNNSDTMRNYLSNVLVEETTSAGLGTSDFSTSEQLRFDMNANATSYKLYRYLIYSGIHNSTERTAVYNFLNQNYA